MKRYTKSDIMKVAHRMYKFNKEHFPYSTYRFGDYLRMAWEEMKFAEYGEDRIEAEEFADFDACFDNPPVNH